MVTVHFTRDDYQAIALNSKVKIVEEKWRMKSALTGLDLVLNVASIGQANTVGDNGRAA